MPDESERRAKLIERYVDGDMSGAEIEALEMELLADRELLEEVELATHFEVAMQDAASSYQAWRYGSMSRMQQLAELARNHVFVPALVALAMVSLGLNIWFWVQSAAPAGDGPTPGQFATSNVLVVPLSTLRTAATEAAIEIHLQPDIEWLVLLPQHLPLASTKLRLSLIDDSGTVLWSDDAKPSPEQSVVVPAEMFNDGTFTLQLAEFRDAAARPARTNYRFTIHRTAQ